MSTNSTDQVINGTPGNDTLIGNNGDDSISGGAGNDTLNGSNGDDTLNGDAGNDSILGANGADQITGGEGNDTMTGGAGADTFIFNFSVTGGPLSTFAVADGTRQNIFSTEYTAWLEELVCTYDLGSDTDGDGVVSVGINQNEEGGTPQIEGMTESELQALFAPSESVMIQTGKVQHERWYSSSFGDEESVVSSDGHDIINNFSQGNTTDTLMFAGVTQHEFDALFQVAVVGSNTVITITGNAAWSLTLNNYTGPLDGLIAFA